ncbi:uncharacterized protein LOC131434329 [Malaya genurostris]|uniref:uncharacterized protein LOC131434329 n=1 Tax=Malaya genurostris TaxID=325434 RepID=UPI0026F3A363|nr:uncharacterized protein LOC131434329 [Malaya genurostris]
MIGRRGMFIMLIDIMTAIEILGENSGSYDGNLVLQKLGIARTISGSYDVRVSVNLEELLTIMDRTRQGVQSLVEDCKAAPRTIDPNRCRDLIKMLEEDSKEIYDLGEMIRRSPRGRKRRSVWNAIGLMDSEDRRRMDMDIDRLRGNEEKIKELTYQQTAAVDSIYNLVNESVHQIDLKAIETYRKDEEMKNEVLRDMNQTESTRDLLLMEMTEIRKVVEWRNITHLKKSMRNHHRNVPTSAGQFLGNPILRLRPATSWRLELPELL